MKEERQRSLEANTVIEETKSMLAEAGSVDTYVPSKLEQVPSASVDAAEPIAPQKTDEPASPLAGGSLEMQMMTQVTLSEKKKDSELVAQPTSEEEPLSTHASDDNEEDKGGDDAAQHGYTETVVVKQDEPKDDTPLNGGDEEPIGAVNVVRDDSPSP